jgi:hypothetical protein
MSEKEFTTEKHGISWIIAVVEKRFASFFEKYFCASPCKSVVKKIEITL